MNRITIISLRKAISPIIASQIQNIKQVERVNLDPKDLEPKESDSPMTREIKSQVKQRLESTQQELASHAVDLIDKAIETENQQLEIGRRLRKEAEAYFAKARKIHNARVHLMETAESLPIALELELVDQQDIGVVAEHVKTLNVPDYFAQRNKVEADKTA